MSACRTLLSLGFMLGILGVTAQQYGPLTHGSLYIAGAFYAAVATLVHVAKALWFYWMRERT